jgi:hypothetical protein
MKSILAFSCLLVALSTAALPSGNVTGGSVAGSAIQAGEEEELIHGIVKERTEEELVVTDPTDETQQSRVRLTKRTKYYKENGEEGDATDVVVGGQVTVKMRNQLEGKPEALEVKVLRSKVRE